jgi:hypothetical protein
MQWTNKMYVLKLYQYNAELMYMETIKEKPGVTREDPNVLIVQPNKQM